MPDLNGFNTIDDYLAGTIPEGGKLLCPFHGDRRPSARVLPGSGRFYCFTCGIREDPLGIAMRTLFPDSFQQYRSREMAFAREWLDRMGRVPVAPSHDQKPPAPIDPAVYRAMTVFCDAANERLGHDADALAELRERQGLRDPVALGFGVGHWRCLDRVDEVCTTAVAGWEARREDVLTQAGLIVPTQDGPKYRLAHRYVLPEYRTINTSSPLGPAGTRFVPFFQARARDDDAKVKYLSPPVPRAFYGVDSLKRPNGVVFVGEGAFDVAPLIEVGESALAVLGIQLGERLDEIVQLVGGRLAVICYDNDEPKPPQTVGPGHAQALVLHAKLSAAGVTAAIVYPPRPYQDLGEWLARVPAARVAAEIKLGS